MHWLLTFQDQFQGSSCVTSLPGLFSCDVTVKAWADLCDVGKKRRRPWSWQGRSQGKARPPGRCTRTLLGTWHPHSQPPTVTQFPWVTPVRGFFFGFFFFYESKDKYKWCWGYLFCFLKIYLKCWVFCLPLLVATTGVGADWTGKSRCSLLPLFRWEGLRWWLWAQEPGSRLLLPKLAARASEVRFSDGKLLNGLDCTDECMYI